VFRRGKRIILSYTHTTQAEHRAERSSTDALGVHTIKSGIEGEEPGPVLKGTYPCKISKKIGKLNSLGNFF